MYPGIGLFLARNHHLCHFLHFLTRCAAVPGPFWEAWEAQNRHFCSELLYLLTSGSRPDSRGRHPGRPAAGVLPPCLPPADSHLAKPATREALRQPGCRSAEGRPRTRAGTAGRTLAESRIAGVDQTVTGPGTQPAGSPGIVTFSLLRDSVTFLIPRDSVTFAIPSLSFLPGFPQASRARVAQSATSARAREEQKVQKVTIPVFARARQESAESDDPRLPRGFPREEESWLFLGFPGLPPRIKVVNKHYVPVSRVVGDKNIPVCTADGSSRARSDSVTFFNFRQESRGLNGGELVSGPEPEEQE